MSQAEDRRRRMSVLTRRDVRQNNIEGAERLRQIAKEEENHLLEERREGVEASKAMKRKMQEDRRKSFAGRNEAWSRRKEIEEALKSQAAQEEHESYELKFAGQDDANAYKRQMKEEKRKSMEGRNAAASRAAQWAEEARTQKIEEEHQSYELAWVGQDDAASYKRQMKEEERQDYENRNREGFEQKKMLEEQRMDQLHNEHESYELKWAGQDDAAAYHRHLKEERRKSFAARNEHHSEQMRIVAELNAIAREEEHESLVLKWAAQDDGAAYRRQLAAERRLSLQGRGEHARHCKAVDEENRAAALNAQAEDSTLSAACARDVSAYKKACAERDRQSLCFRAKEARVARLEDEARKDIEAEVEQENCELEAAARQDVRRYVDRCRDRRRMSLCHRAAEKRHHAEVAQLQKEEVRETRFSHLSPLSTSAALLTPAHPIPRPRRVS